MKICNLQVDVEMNDNGEFDVWISNENSSGCHYECVTTEEIGYLVAGEIDMYVDEEAEEDE